MWAVWVKAWSAGSNWLSGGWGTAKGYLQKKYREKEMERDCSLKGKNNSKSR